MLAVRKASTGLPRMSFSVCPYDEPSHHLSAVRFTLLTNVGTQMRDPGISLALNSVKDMPPFPHT